MTTLIKQTFEKPNIVNKYSVEITEEQKIEFQNYLQNLNKIDLPEWVSNLHFNFIETKTIENDLSTYGKVHYSLIPS
tara:strand:+ start:72 stop:302 length:231 start_codon:yes stop_codon:yes gene_type:complete